MAELPLFIWNNNYTRNALEMITNRINKTRMAPTEVKPPYP